MCFRNWTLLLLIILVVVDEGLAAVISTANCNFFRQNYGATLQLVYAYKIEFASGSKKQLEGTEIAIANAVAQALDTCDDMDRPLFAVKTGVKHTFTGQDDSAVAHGNLNTHFAIGTTQVLLDYFSSQAREEAYAAIRGAFKNATIIKIFDQTVVQTEYMYAVNEALIFPEEETTSGNEGELTVVVAIATGIVAFLVAALLCFGLMHERKKTKAQYNRSHGSFDKFESLSSSRSQKSDLISSNRSFSRLTDDFSSSEYSMSVESYHDPQNYLPSTIWSVSDITSDDSGSIRSFLSRATTKLESIEEGEENEEMMEMNRRRRKRRTLKEYDCCQFKKGSVYISNLAQCQDALTMPKTDDLEVGMAKDLPILLDSTNQGLVNAVSKVQHSCSYAKAGLPTCSGKEELGEAEDDFKKSKTLTIVSTAEEKKKYEDMAAEDKIRHQKQKAEATEEERDSDNDASMISTNVEKSEPNDHKCDSMEDASEKSELPGTGEVGQEMLANSYDVKRDNCADERNSIGSAIGDDSVGMDSIDANASIEDSAHINHEHSVNVMTDQDEDGLQIDTTVVVSSEAGITPLASNLVGTECMIDTGSPSMLIFDDSEIQKTEALTPCVMPVDASSKIQDSPIRHDEASCELDRENTSLYSLDMDETIVTIIDDIIAAIDDSKLLETTAEQSKTSGSNETTLDEIHTEKSDDSFFVDDESTIDIEDSGRKTEMVIPSSSITQSRRRFVFKDVTNSLILDELKKKKHVTSDEASDANTAYTI